MKDKTENTTKPRKTEQTKSGGLNVIESNKPKSKEDKKDAN